MAKRERHAPLPQNESEVPPEPESGEPLSDDHARDVAEETEPEHDRDVAEDDNGPLPDELQTLPGITLRRHTVTCKRCGNTYTLKEMDTGTDFSCTDRRCPIAEEMYP